MSGCRGKVGGVGISEEERRDIGHELGPLDRDNEVK